MVSLGVYLFDHWWQIALFLNFFMLPAIFIMFRIRARVNSAHVPVFKRRSGWYWP